MGYEIERFISEISDNLICKLCHKVYDNPKSLTSCDHIFCFSCIEKIVINENCCPLDHTLIESSCIEEAPPFILDYLSVMKIKCDFSEHGCRESVPLNRLLLHRLNCEFHPERKIKCTNCEVDVEKYRLSDHNCINLLKNKIDFLSDQINDLKNYYNNELSSLRCRLEKLNHERECSGLASDRPMVSFSCIGDNEMGTNEMIYIHTINHLTLQCYISRVTKISKIKYQCCTITNLKTTESSLYCNGQRLEDYRYISYYHLRNGSICELFPNEIYITFDCIDIKQIIGFSVSINDTIDAIIGQLNNELRKVIPNQLFQYLKQCSGVLYFNDVKLDKSTQLFNYKVLEIRVLKYCNRLAINI